MIASATNADIALRVGFERARELMLASAEPLPSESVALSEAGGRVLAEVLRAGSDIVPYARSGMDGFALRARDCAGAGEHGVTLPVIGMLYAGDASPQLASGTAMAIATGAPLPHGADAVVPIEDVEQRGATIFLSAPLRAGDHVFQPGDDARCGDILARPGDPITAGRAALLAAAGHARVRVHRRPRVAIVCTGDEVVAVGAFPLTGQIRNSNEAMLAVALARDGAELVFATAVGDAPGPLAVALREAMACSDLVITTGGASVGERDRVKETLVALGARFAFRSVALRPAKPAALARRGHATIAVLPGNPAAAFVAYAVLVRGLVRKLAGRSDPYPAGTIAVLDGSIRAKPERHYVMFGRLTSDGHGFSVAPLENQCSSLVRTAADANALIVVPPGKGVIAAGSLVSVERVE
jgi:molybdopterin molybdotransferase